ncbi:hypothetical protein ABK040_016447 [Willaertia magna]
MNNNQRRKLLIDRPLSPGSAPNNNNGNYRMEYSPILGMDERIFDTSSTSPAAPPSTSFTSVVNSNNSPASGNASPTFFKNLLMKVNSWK